MTRKRICIIAFQDVKSTSHVLRQIDYLSPHYDLTVIGHGSADPAWKNVTWHSVPESTIASKIYRFLYYAIALAIPSMYDVWYWNTRRFRDAYRHALASQADAIHANNWQALPIAVEVARRTGARVVFHQHEYAELEREGDPVWCALVSPAIRSMLARYTSDPRVRVDASITINQPFAERYRRELGIAPIVVYNAPEPVDVPDRSAAIDPARIRLIYHGSPQRARGIEELIQAIALAERRFTLELMLMPDDPGYIAHLRRVAAERAPGRVVFRDPVPPREIVRAIAEYDIGAYVIKPSTYNFRYVLPNKFFEYIQAGLAVCIGPSPAMAALVRQYGVGVCTASFEPGAVAAALDGLTVEQLRGMRRAARVAAGELNADVEMGKVVALYRRLLAGGEAVGAAGATAPGG